MANTLTSVIPTIFAKAMLALRPYVGLPRLVNTDFSRESAMRGSTISIPIASAGTVKTVSPSSTPGTADDSTMAAAQVVLDQWKYVDFVLTDKDVANMEAETNFIPPVMSEKLKTLTNDINSYIGGLLRGCYNSVGVPATTPFASSSDLLVDARKLLTDTYTPPDNRFGLFDSAAAAKMLKLAEFKNQYQSGDPNVMMKGLLGEKFGFQLYENQNVYSFDGTTLSAGALTVNGVNAIAAGSTDGGRNGTISLAKATNTGTLTAGTVFTIAGFTQQYVVTTTTALSVGNTTVPIAPALKLATAGSEVVTIVAASLNPDSVLNFVAHRDAIAFASRVPKDLDVPGLTGGSVSIPLTDPVSGVAFRLQAVRQHFQTAWFIDTLYGATLARPEMACRIEG